MKGKQNHAGEKRSNTGGNFVLGDLFGSDDGVRPLFDYHNVNVETLGRVLFEFLQVGGYIGLSASSDQSSVKLTCGHGDERTERWCASSREFNAALLALHKRLSGSAT